VTYLQRGSKRHISNRLRPSFEFTKSNRALHSTSDSWKGNTTGANSLKKTKFGCRLFASEMLDQTFIDGLILKQRRSRFIYASLTGLASCVGGGGLVWFIAWVWRTQHQPDLLNLLPTVFSAFGLIPWKEVKANNDKIDVLEMVKARLHHRKGSG
jgi:hypothetical protein